MTSFPRLILGPLFLGAALAAALAGPAAAQAVADALVAAGVCSILNFAPAVLAVPEGVVVRKVDLGLELQILTYYEQRTAALEQVRRRGRRSGATSRS